MENVSIYKLDHQGRGIGKINNVVVFVANALPDEEVKIKVIKQKKNYLEGKIIEIVKESSKRIEPICPYFFKCGGCDLMHLNYSEQLIYKTNLVKDIFNRYAQFEVKINDIISCNNLYYRNKVTFQVADLIGFYENKTNKIIDIDKCYIAEEKINYLLTKIKNNLNLKNISRIIIKTSKNTEETMIIFETTEKLNIDFLKSDVSSIIVKNKTYKTLYGKDSIIEKIKNYQFTISADAFFQTNTEMTEKLYEEILKLGQFKENDTVLDLYCGTGTIGIYISAGVKQVIGVEINKSAIEDANVNKKLNDIDNISFINGDAGTVLENTNCKADVVIIDPPRSGLSNKALTEILKIASSKIIYVSCNPLTLVRDLNVLNEKYEIISVTPFDMFPNTHHVECVCVLNKR